jgi:enoyl-CoA hydratase/carnithine racemase
MQVSRSAADCLETSPVLQANGRVFCAGGDLNMFYSLGKSSMILTRTTFRPCAVTNVSVSSGLRNCSNFLCTNVIDIPNVADDGWKHVVYLKYWLDFHLSTFKKPIVSIF